jgi:hypothetical protein
VCGFSQAGFQDLAPIALLRWPLLVCSPRQRQLDESDNSAPQVLGKKHNTVGPADKVSPAQFVQVWRAMGITVPQRLATAIFSKHGHDADGRMPVQVGRSGCRIGRPGLM